MPCEPVERWRRRRSGGARIRGAPVGFVRPDLEEEEEEEEEEEPCQRYGGVA